MKTCFIYLLVLGILFSQFQAIDARRAKKKKKIQEHVKQTNLYIVVDTSASTSLLDDQDVILDPLEQSINEFLPKELKKNPNFNVYYIGFATEATLYDSINEIESHWKHPGFYTNWEDAFTLIPDSADFVMFYVDGYPNTYNGDSPPTPDVGDESLARAAIQISRLQESGTLITPLMARGSPKYEETEAIFGRHVIEFNHDGDSLYENVGNYIKNLCMSEDLDECGECHGDSSSCSGCDGVPNSGNVNDACGMCGGDGSSCSMVVCNFMQNPEQNIMSFKVTVSKKYDKVMFNIGESEEWNTWHRQTILDVQANEELHIEQEVEKYLHYKIIDMDELEKDLGFSFENEDSISSKVDIILTETDAEDEDGNISSNELRTSCAFEMNVHDNMEINAYWKKMFCLGGDVFAILSTESPKKLSKFYVSITQEVNFYPYQLTSTNENYDEDQDVWQQDWEISTINGIKTPHAGGDYPLRFIWETDEDVILKDIVFSSDQDCGSSISTEQDVLANFKSYRDPIRKKPETAFSDGDKIYSDIELLLPNDSCDKFDVDVSSVRLCISEIPILPYDNENSAHTGCNSASVYEEIVIYQHNLEFLTYEETLESITGKKSGEEYQFTIIKPSDVRNANTPNYANGEEDSDRSIESAANARSCSVHFNWDATTFTTPDQYAIFEVTWVAKEKEDVNISPNDENASLESREMHMSKRKQGISTTEIDINCKKNKAFSRKSRQCVEYHECEDEEEYHGDCYFYGHGSSTFLWLGIFFALVFFGVLAFWFASSRHGSGYNGKWVNEHGGSQYESIQKPIQVEQARSAPSSSIYSNIPMRKKR